jgi:AmmeMemoRadiSam system protein B
MSRMSDLRPSPIAGQWYPGDPNRLRASVEDYLEGADSPELGGEIVGLIAPHAGHTYSGPVAGHAFAAARGLTPELVAVVSPMHHHYSQPLLTSDHDAYKTPLGPVPIDKTAVEALDQRLRTELGFGLAPVRQDAEHALEIELPFLQLALRGEFSLLPVMMRDQSRKVARALGRALAQTLGARDALMVASTDLSHFYPQEVARTLDTEMLKRVGAFDPEGVLQAEEEGKGFACGRGAMAAVLWAAKDMGADRVTILNYATSGDITGDFSRVVGYGAAVITRVTADGA